MAIEGPNLQNLDLSGDRTEGNAAITEKPQILLIDIESSIVNALKMAGHNVSPASFGTPYYIRTGNTFHPLLLNGKFPHNYAEHDIVVVDLTPSPTQPDPPVERSTLFSENHAWLTNSLTTQIDPRLLAMLHVQSKFDRILSNGGIFVVFASAPIIQVIGTVNGSGQLPVSNWGFLQILSELAPTNILGDFGQEITVYDQYEFLSRHMKGAKFSCVFEVPSDPQWAVFAVNKFGKPVAVGHITDSKGKIYLLPHVKDKAGFLKAMLSEILPATSPQLFPNAKTALWIYEKEYELPRVLGLRGEIEQIHQESAARIASLENAIETERQKMAYLHGLLTEMDKSLVEAVKVALSSIGFQDIVDVDNEKPTPGTTKQRREDLWIRVPNEPLVLVEIKGITRSPTEDESLTVLKYLVPRMKELKDTDIRGLTIINHERHKRAMERAKEPFQPDVVTTAKGNSLTLMTAWDLFRLVRSFMKNSWKHEQIRPLFYQDGLFIPIPTHYEYIGIIEGFLPKAKAVGIRIDTLSLKCGDRIAFELPVEFVEQEIESLQINGQSVTEASQGMIAGTLTDLRQDQAKKNIRVFRVQKD